MRLHRVATTRRADEDINSAVTYYVDVGASEAALAFVDALENAKDLLSEHPSIGSPRFALEINVPELRSVTVQRFPYVLFYSEDSDAIRIHRVLHMSRDIPTELLEP